MLLKTRPPAVPVAPPVQTAEKRLHSWARSGFDSGPNEGLDIAALKARYSPDRAYEPRMYEATFRVPLGASGEAFATEQAYNVYRWIAVWEKRGFDWLKERGVQVYPGRYPAHDLATGCYILDEREFVARAWFRCRSPKTNRLEIRPELLQRPA